MKWLKRMFGAAPQTASTVAKTDTGPARPQADTHKAKTVVGVPATVDILQTESYDFEVVGESFYQDELWSIVGDPNDQGQSMIVTAWLICEPSNKHDRNAVAVFINEKRVAYLSKPDAKEYRASLKELTGGIPSARTKAAIVGGGLHRRTGERLSLGVRLDLELPIEID